MEGIDYVLAGQKRRRDDDEEEEEEEQSGGSDPGFCSACGSDPCECST